MDPLEKKRMVLTMATILLMKDIVPKKMGGSIPNQDDDDCDCGDYECSYCHGDDCDCEGCLWCVCCESHWQGCGCEHAAGEYCEED